MWTLPLMGKGGRTGGGQKTERSLWDKSEWRWIAAGAGQKEDGGYWSWWDQSQLLQSWVITAVLRDAGAVPAVREEWKMAAMRKEGGFHHHTHAVWLHPEQMSVLGCWSLEWNQLPLLVEGNSLSEHWSGVRRRAPCHCLQRCRTPCSHTQIVVQSARVRLHAAVPIWDAAGKPCSVLAPTENAVWQAQCLVPSRFKNKDIWGIRWTLSDREKSQSVRISFPGQRLWDGGEVSDCSSKRILT